MRHTIKFTKVSGAGNDFVLIENIDNNLGVDKPRLAVALCSRHFGIGGDGLLLLERSSVADFSMRYYNADGSYGGMCGNGGRCIARYAYLHGIAGSTMHFDALGYTYRAQVVGDSILLRMKPPQAIQCDIPFQIGDRSYEIHSINTGSPHVVVFDENLPSADVGRIGRLIRHDVRFAPEGTNVNFVRHHAEQTLEMRTYERGVESETLACGTGAVASALIAALKKGLQSPVIIQTRSGEQLIVHFKIAGHDIIEVILEGSAHILFLGKVEYDDSMNRIIDYVAEEIPGLNSQMP